MKTRFDLEQEIMICWNVVDDINAVIEFIGDDEFFAGMKPEHQDKLMNLLIGMSELYSMKFDKTFRTFEQLVHNKEL